MGSREISASLLIKKWEQIYPVIEPLSKLSETCASLKRQQKRVSSHEPHETGLMGELTRAFLELVKIFERIRLPSIKVHSALRHRKLLGISIKKRLAHFRESISGSFADALQGHPADLVDFATHELVALKQAVIVCKQNYAKTTCATDHIREFERVSEYRELFKAIEKAFCKLPVVRQQLDLRAMQMLNETSVIPLKETDQLILDLTKSECFYKTYFYKLGQDKTLILKLCIEADGEFVSFKKFDIKNAGRHIDEMPGGLTDLFDRQPRRGTRIPKEILNTLKITLKQS